jgi:hypothetical protein
VQDGPAEIQRTEIVVVVLYFRALAHGVPDAGEYVHDALPHNADGVQAAGGFRQGRPGTVAGFLLTCVSCSCACLQFFPAVLGGVFQLVQPLAPKLFLLYGHLLQLVQQAGHFAVAAQHVHAECFHGVGSGGCGILDLGLYGRYAFFQVHSITRIQTRTSVSGLSYPSQGKAAMRSSTSMPSTTCPKTV